MQERDGTGAFMQTSMTAGAKAGPEMWERPARAETQAAFNA
jgi:hypothetical protein